MKLISSKKIIFTFADKPLTLPIFFALKISSTNPNNPSETKVNNDVISLSKLQSLEDIRNEINKDIVENSLDNEKDDDENLIDTTALENDLTDPGLENPLKNMKNTLGNKKSWNSNISLSYSYSATNPSNPTKNFWANTTSTINITPKWKVSYRARFDLMERDLVSHSFSIYRDLHCWELSLNWTPTGIGQGINFRLNVKSPTLRDLKVEKRGGVYSGAGF